jgi:hypothetical protein
MNTLTQDCANLLREFYHELFEGGIIDKLSLNIFLEELEVDANGEEN